MVKDLLDFTTTCSSVLSPEMLVKSEAGGVYHLYLKGKTNGRQLLISAILNCYQQQLITAAILRK